MKYLALAGSRVSGNFIRHLRDSNLGNLEFLFCLHLLHCRCSTNYILVNDVFTRLIERVMIRQRLCTT